MIEAHKIPHAIKAKRIVEMALKTVKAQEPDFQTWPTQDREGAILDHLRTHEDGPLWQAIRDQVETLA